MKLIIHKAIDAEEIGLVAHTELLVFIAGILEAFLLKQEVHIFTLSSLHGIRFNLRDYLFLYLFNSLGILLLAFLLILLFFSIFIILLLDRLSLIYRILLNRLISYILLRIFLLILGVDRFIFLFFFLFEIHIICPPFLCYIPTIKGEIRILSARYQLLSKLFRFIGCK